MSSENKVVSAAGAGAKGNLRFGPRSKTGEGYKIQRYYHCTTTWTQKKRECTCRVPDILDLEPYRAKKKNDDGVADGEKKMAGGAAAGAPAAEVVPDAEMLQQLQMMGFSENGCKRACIAVKNSGVEAASEWIFAHMEDPDFNDPPAKMKSAATPAPAAAAAGGASDNFSPEAIGMCTMLGFSEAHAKKALKNSGGDAERAADWLFAHADELDAMGGDDDAAADKKLDDGPGKYNLLGFVSHVGKNTGSGHYVAHIKKNGEWVIFDDEKVAKSQNPPFDYGYLYCFKRE